MGGLSNDGCSPFFCEVAWRSLENRRYEYVDFVDVAGRRNPGRRAAGVIFS